MLFKNNFYILLIFAIVSLLLTCSYLGFKHIGFTSLDWLVNYDQLSDYLALNFYLKDGWHFPLGLNPNYGDLPNSIVYSGAVPLLSILSKLFVDFLPINFHYFSAWIFLSFFFQQLFSYKLIYFYTKNITYSLISSFFFLLTPILIYRLSIHLSLGAHWIILAIFFLELNNKLKYKFFYRVLLISISCLVHFYFTIIIYLISFLFIFFRLITKKKFKELLFTNLFIYFCIFTTMYIVGYFSIPVTDSLGYGFGIYKSNFLSLLDPGLNLEDANWSKILPDIYTSAQEKEGFAYLGLGIIFLIIISIFKLIDDFNFKNTNHLSLLAIIIIFFLLSITQNISIADFHLFNFQLPKIIYALFSIARASGRFIWVVVYILMLFSIITLYRKKYYYKNLVLVFLLIIQLFDIKNGLNYHFNEKKNNYVQRNNDKNKYNLNLPKDINALYETYPKNTSDNFLGSFNFLIHNEFKKTNIARLGRYNREAVSVSRADTYSNLLDKKVGFDKVFLISNRQHLIQIKQLYLSSENFGIIFRNGFWFLIPGGKKLMTKEDYNFLNKIQPPKIQKNNVHNLSWSTKDSILGIGWSHGSYGGTISNNSIWTEGYKSTLIFYNDIFETINSIKLKINKIEAPDKEKLNVEFYLNDVLVDKTSFLRNFNGIYEIKDLAIKDGINTFLIKIINPSTPVSKLTSVDGRLLGILLESFELK